MESGCALILASVGPDLEPHASRGWGLDVVDEHRVRLLVAADDERLHAHIGANGAIAVTASSVRTLRSIQMKGRATGPEPGTDADAARMQRYLDEFFADVETTDGVPPALLQRIVPAELVAYVVDVEAMFDQTPGPNAGSAIAR